MLLWLYFGLEITQPIPVWALIVGLMGLLVGLFPKRPSVSQPWWLFGCLQLDIAALALLLFLSGGASNPFVSLLLLPLLIAAALLPKRCVWAMSVVTVTVYTLLMFYYRPLPGMLSGHGPGFEAHLWGMWLVFLISVLLIAGFVAPLARAFREREHETALLRERALRDEQILALGLFAASTAHELGTPLSTIAVLTQEIQQAYQHDSELAADIHLLRQQVDICKTILNNLLKSADSAVDKQTTLPLDHVLEQIRRRWPLLRPQVPLRVNYDGQTPGPPVLAPHLLSQTLLTLLNNAADACPTGVDLAGRLDATQQRIIVEIHDGGREVAENVLRQAGEAFFSTKPDGIGIGLFLANSTLERLGGQVRLWRDPQGITCTRVELPVIAGG